MGKHGRVQSWYPSGSTAWPIGARRFFVFVSFSGIFSTRPRREHLPVDFLKSALVWVATPFDGGNGSEQNRAFRIDYRFERANS